MQRLAPVWIVPFVLVLALGCGSETPAPADPCAPNGHLHAEDGGMYCHCFGDYRGEGLRCVPRGPAGDASSDAATEDASVDAPPPEDRPGFEGIEGACWSPPGSTCHPRTNAGCEEGSVCVRTAVTTFGCVPVDATVAAGASCNNARRCGPGLVCLSNRCLPACCARSDCADARARCLPLNAASGTFGGCSTCQGAGNFCNVSGDCCSNDCHDNHCH